MLRDLDGSSIDLCALAVVHFVAVEAADREHELFAVHLLDAFQFVDASVVAVVRPEEKEPGVVPVVAVGMLDLPELGPEHSLAVRIELEVAAAAVVIVDAGVEQPMVVGQLSVTAV